MTIPQLLIWSFVIVDDLGEEDNTSVRSSYCKSRRTMPQLLIYGSEGKIATRTGGRYLRLSGRRTIPQTVITINRRTIPQLL
jgi:hypothetical protein